MVISSESHAGQYADEDYREDAPHVSTRDLKKLWFILDRRLPHKIIQFPMDDSALTEIEKERIMNKRTGKTKSRLLKIDISVDDEDEPEGEMLDMSSIIDTEILEKSENVVNEDSKPKKKNKKWKKKKGKTNVWDINYLNN